MQPRIVLASASPRRKLLLSQWVEQFEVFPAELDEDSLTEIDPFVTCEKLALAKAESVAVRFPSCLTIGCDTVVALEIEGRWSQFAKPRDFEDAVDTLQNLSGRTHIVATGVALVCPSRQVHCVFHEKTEVTFHVLSEAMIREYVATGEPMDKAGAYGAQGMASGFVAKLAGNLDNVIGLPMASLRSALEDLGYRHSLP